MHSPIFLLHKSEKGLVELAGVRGDVRWASMGHDVDAQQGVGIHLANELASGW